MIEAATILSAILIRWDDFAIIFLLLLMNGIFNFYLVTAIVILLLASLNDFAIMSMA